MINYIIDRTIILKDICMNMNYTIIEIGEYNKLLGFIMQNLIK